MGRPAGWMKELTGRSPMKSPGKPSLRRDVERVFWREIAEGLTSEDAAVAVGVSPAAGSRWFRERGGMATFMLTPVTGRYLSFEEREEVAGEVARMRRSRLSFSTAMWVPVPFPAEANWISPGLASAAAMSWVTVVMPDRAPATRT
jgi:hypothetical protein